MVRSLGRSLREANSSQVEAGPKALWPSKRWRPYMKIGRDLDAATEVPLVSGNN